jgi:hypothetical protein
MSLKMLNPATRATRPQHAEHEDRARAPEGDHEQDEVRQRRAAELPHRVGHAAERAERRRPHDQPDDAEDDSRDVLEHAHDPLAQVGGEHRDGGGGQDREDEDLEDLVVDERLHEARRQEVVGDERDHAGVLARLADRLLRRRGGRVARPAVEPGAGAHDVRREEPERERDDRRAEEVGQRPQRQAARAGEVAEGRDTDHDGDEDHRPGDGLDELDEGVGQPLRLDGGVGHGQAEHDAGGDGDEHPHPELAGELAARAALVRRDGRSGHRSSRDRPPLPGAAG